MKRALLLATMVAVSTLAFSQQPVAGVPTPVTAQPNSIYVGADGKFEAAPDTALLQFTIAPQEDNARAAYDRAARAAEQVRQILRKNGIDPKSAEIGYYSLSPVYDWRSPKRKLIGYRVSSSVVLKLKDFTKLAAVVQETADLDATENQSLNYILEDMDAAKVKAAEDAYQHVHGMAEAIAKVGGRTLGELSYSAVDTYEQPRPMPVPRVMMRAGVAGEQAPAPTEEFTPQKVTVTAHVNAVFTLR